MAIQMTGLAGFDWHALIDQLIQIESYPLRNIKQRIDANEAKKEAWSKFDAFLKDLRGAGQKLLDRAAFDKVSASVSTTSSGVTPFKATVSGNASAGSHQIEVVSLAEAEVYASQGFESSTNALNFAGNLTINGKTISIDADNSLAAIRDAINAADAGVSASILETIPGMEYKLVIKSDTKGAEGIELGDPDGIAAQLGLSITVEGKDAILVIDGLEVRRKSNTITDVVPGVTLELYRTSQGETVSLTLTQDQEGIAKLVESWIDAYNQIKIFINTQQTAPEEGKTAPPLFGDSGIKSANSALQSALGFDLYELGITRTNDGLLDFDKDRFLERLATDPDHIKKLFQVVSRSTNPDLNPIHIPVTAVAGLYEIEITSVATRATLAGGGFDGIFNVTGAGNRTISITDAYSGQTLNFVVLDGESTADIVSRLNQELAAQGIGIQASVSSDGTNITLTHNQYGAQHGFSIQYSDPDLDQLGLAQGEYRGTDVQGTVNGRPATGSGQELVSEEGLRILYTGTTTGKVGAVDVSIGAAARTEAAIYGIALDQNSTIATSKTSIDQIINRLQTQKLRIEAQLEQRRALLERQFLAMERMISAMQSQNAFITAGLGGLLRF